MQPTARPAARPAARLLPARHAARPARMIGTAGGLASVSPASPQAARRSALTCASMPSLASDGVRTQTRRSQGSRQWRGVRAGGRLPAGRPRRRLPERQPTATSRGATIEGSGVVRPLFPFAQSAESQADLPSAKDDRCAWAAGCPVAAGVRDGATSGTSARARSTMVAWRKSSGAAHAALRR